jgi:hypothetical protein
MEPRDVPVMWWWGHSRGRRDLLIFRAQLRAAPHFDLDARTPKNWMDRTTNSARENGRWTPVQGGLANNMRADYRGGISPFSINPLIVKATVDGVELSRLAVHGDVPNLEVHFVLPKFDRVSTRRVFETLRQLAEEVLKI